MVRYMQKDFFKLQFEHTIVVTKEGCEVLTRRDALLKNSEDKPWSKLGPLTNFVS